MSDGENTPKWSDALPEDVRGWDEVKNSDVPEKFWNQMINMRSRMGSSIRIPSDDAGEEDRAAFHKKLQEKVPGLMSTPNYDDETTLNDVYAKMGRPAEAKDYKVPEFKDSKGNVLKDAGKAVAESLRDAAFKAGLSQKKYEELLASIVTPSIGTHERTLELQQADRTKLAEKWGVAHERNTTTVNNFLKHTDAPEGVLKALEAGTVDSDTMTWIHSLATNTISKKSGFQSDNSDNSVMSPDEAAIKISEIRNNKAHPYNNRMDPGNASAKKFMRELYLLKNPGSEGKAAPGTQFNIGGGIE